MMVEDTSIKGLRLRNAELIKQRDVISVKTKEGREAIDRLNKEIDENNDLIRRNGIILTKQMYGRGDYY